MAYWLRWLPPVEVATALGLLPPRDPLPNNQPRRPPQVHLLHQIVGRMASGGSVNWQRRLTRLQAAALCSLSMRVPLTQCCRELDCQT